MSLYDFLTNTYNQFVAIFPTQIQWLVTLLVLVGLVGALFALIRHNVLFIIVAIVLLPFLIPVLARFLIDFYHFFQYLVQELRLTAPANTSSA